jgi:hypothetical protein
LNRKSRAENLNYILVTCRRNGWNFDTPNLAGKLETIIKQFGFTKRTRRDYLESTIDILELEKRTGPFSTLGREPLQETSESLPKEAKRDKRNDSIIYSSPIPLIPPERVSQLYS